MKILLDNCVTGKTRELLQEAGFSVVTLKQLRKSSIKTSIAYGTSDLKLKFKGKKTRSSQ